MAKPKAVDANGTALELNDLVNSVHDGRLVDVRVVMVYGRRNLVHVEYAIDDFIAQEHPEYPAKTALVLNGHGAHCEPTCLTCQAIHHRHSQPRDGRHFVKVVRLNEHRKMGANAPKGNWCTVSRVASAGTEAVDVPGIEGAV